MKTVMAAAMPASILLAVENIGEIPVVIMLFLIIVIIVVVLRIIRMSVHQRRHDFGCRIRTTKVAIFFVEIGIFHNFAIL